LKQIAWVPRRNQYIFLELGCTLRPSGDMQLSKRR